MKVLLDKDNVVVAVAEEIEKVSNGFLVVKENAVYALPDLRVVDAEINPTPYKDKLVDGVIIQNPTYKTLEEIDKLVKEIEAKQILDMKAVM
jgi:hypothetical protein